VTDQRKRRGSSWRRADLAAKAAPALTRHRLSGNRHRLRGMSAVAVAGLLLAACGGDEPESDASNPTKRSNTVEVFGTDRLAFEPDKLAIPAGREVTLELTARSLEHDLIIEGAAASGTADENDEADDPDDLHVAHADAGDTVTTTFSIDEPGTYTVYCSVPGHRAAGMVASLEVIETKT
jgi:plastocyanin